MRGERRTVIEDEADALLEADARKRGKSLRRLGIIDQRRERTVFGRELPFSSVFTGTQRQDDAA